MIDVIGLQHTGVIPVPHRCEPRIFALCTRCLRRVTWCLMTTEEILLVTARQYVCNDCLENGR